MMCTYIEAEPSQAQSSCAQAKPSNCTRTTSNKPNQHLLDDVPGGNTLFGICCRCIVENAKPKRASKHLPYRTVYNLLWSDMLCILRYCLAQAKRVCAKRTGARNIDTKNWYGAV